MAPRPISPANLPRSHDLDLVALTAAGERAAFGELVRRHGAAVRALIRRMGADRATADDVAQDAFLSAFEQIAEFRGEGAFQAWVKRIAARLYVRRWRRQAKADALADGPDDEATAHAAEGEAAARIDLDEALKALPEAE